MNTRVLIAAAITLLASGATAYASCTSDGYCTGVGKDVVQSAIVNSNGVLFMPPTGSNPGCTLVSGYYIQLLDTNPHFKEMYATYLYAMANNIQFQLRLDPSQSTCTVAYVRTWN